MRNGESCTNGIAICTPQFTFYFVGEGDLRTSSTRGGQHTLRLVYLTKQKPKADNMDCISRGKKEKGRFVAKGDLSFLTAEYFPTRHWGGGAFEVPAMSLGQLCQRENGEPHQTSRWRRLVSRSNKITLKLVSGPRRLRTNITVRKEGEPNRQHWSEAKDTVMCQTKQAVGLLLWLQESLKTLFVQYTSVQSYNTQHQTSFWNTASLNSCNDVTGGASFVTVQFAFDSKTDMPETQRQTRHSALSTWCTNCNSDAGDIYIPWTAMRYQFSWITTCN